MSRTLKSSSAGRARLLQSHWVLLLISGMLCVFSPASFAQEKQKPKKKANKLPYTISKETTFVTGPVTKDGHIDFVAAINNRYSKGVTPQNNAAVLYLRALGPIIDGKELPKELFKKMGMDVLPLKGQFFIHFGDYLEKKLGLKQNDPQYQKSSENFGTTMSKPWRVREFPHIAGWLRSNEKALELIFEGSKRSQFHLPIVRPPATGMSNISMMDSYHMEVNGEFRSLARFFTCRFMLQIAEGNQQKAWESIITIHRLARHVSRGPTIIDHMVGTAVEQIATENELRFLREFQPNSKEIGQYRKEFASLPSRSRMVDAVDFAERIQFLDTFSQMVTTGLKFAPPAERNKMVEQFDLDTLFRTGMKEFDKVVKVMKIADYLKRDVEFKKLQKDAKSMAEMGAMEKKVKNGKATKVEFSRFMGKMMVTTSLPAFSQLQKIEMREQQHQHNIELAFALAAYRSENKRYPTKLTDLTPKYLVKIPNDLFTGKSLKYKSTKDGYQLYSLGPNGNDDNGTINTELRDGPDDIVVTMPIVRQK